MHKRYLNAKAGIQLTAYIFILCISLHNPLLAQQILFDFNNAPLYGNLPIYQTAGGITAHLSATGQGYSIQNVNVMGFTPQGFTGRMLYPNSIYISDIRVHFDQLLSEFSIMYACQELACDDAARMRVTAYLNGNFVGTDTMTARYPGTWPVDTLRCSFPQGFDSVIIHYDRPPLTCQDYGTIYIADNMRVTPIPVSVISETEFSEKFALRQNYPNPFNPSTEISFTLPKDDYVQLKVYDAAGNEIASLLGEPVKRGNYKVEFDASHLASGVYFYSLITGSFKESKKMVLIK